MKNGRIFWALEESGIKQKETSERRQDHGDYVWSLRLRHARKCWHYWAPTASADIDYFHTFQFTNVRVQSKLAHALKNNENAAIGRSEISPKESFTENEQLSSGECALKRKKRHKNYKRKCERTFLLISTFNICESVLAEPDTCLATALWPISRATWSRSRFCNLTEICRMGKNSVCLTHSRPTLKMDIYSVVFNIVYTRLISLSRSSLMLCPQSSSWSAMWKSIWIYWS